MTDSTSNPDEPDRRVATNDEQAERATDEQDGTATTGTGATRPRPDGDGGQPADATDDSSSNDAGGVDAEATTIITPAKPEQSQQPKQQPSAAESDPDPAGAGDEPATGAGADPEPRTPPSDGQHVPSAAPFRSDGASQEPAVGSGSAAPVPPPWNRVPPAGANGSSGKTPSDPQSEVDRLLQEAPTAFIEPGARGRGESGSSQPSGSTSPWTAARAARNRPPRQAILQLKRLDPWSVLKLALVLAVVLFFIWLVAVGVLYGILDGMGVWDRLNGTYADLVSGDTADSGLISAGPVFGFAAVIGAINSLLFAVAVTVGAFVYNVSADLVGGMEVTLSERD